MKYFLLLLLLCSPASVLFAQAKTLSTLPPGRYITLLKQGSGKWERGDIVLIDGSRYRVTGGEEEGEYRTSITAQRVFFTSGPLKGTYARLMVHNSRPAIELPEAENQGSLAAGVIAVLKP